VRGTHILAVDLEGRRVVLLVIVQNDRRVVALGHVGHLNVAAMAAAAILILFLQLIVLIAVLNQRTVVLVLAVQLCNGWVSTQLLLCTSRPAPGRLASPERAASRPGAGIGGGISSHLARCSCQTRHTGPPRAPWPSKNSATLCCLCALVGADAASYI